MPDEVENKYTEIFYLDIKKVDNQWSVIYKNPDGIIDMCYKDDDCINRPYTISETEAEARGKMLEYLVENKLIEL